MKQTPEDMEDDMPDEIDFTGGVRGKYAEWYAAGTNVVVLDDDVASLYPDAKSVNAALRAFADVARKQTTAIPSTSRTP